MIAEMLAEHLYPSSRARAWLASLPPATTPVEAWRTCDDPRWIAWFIASLDRARGIDLAVKVARFTLEIVRYDEDLAGALVTTESALAAYRRGKDWRGGGRLDALLAEKRIASGAAAGAVEVAAALAALADRDEWNSSGPVLRRSLAALARGDRSFDEGREREAAAKWPRARAHSARSVMCAARAVRELLQCEHASSTAFATKAVEHAVAATSRAAILTLVRREFSRGVS